MQSEAPRAGNGHVDLAFPNAERFAMLARMTGAAMAASAGFSVAEIEDLRCALDGVWSLLHASVPAGDTLRLGFDAKPHCLRLAGGSAVALPGPVQIDITWHAMGGLGPT